MDFRIKVKADLDSSDLQSQINKLSKENLKINIKLNDENIQSQIKQLTKDETKDIAVNIAVKNAEKLQQVNKLADQIVKTVNGQNLGIQIDNKQALSAIKQVEKASEQATKQAAKAQQTLSNAYWKNQFQSVGQKSPILSEMSAYYQQLEKEAQQVEKTSKILNSSSIDAKISSFNSSLSKYSSDSQQYQRVAKSIENVTQAYKEAKSARDAYDADMSPSNLNSVINSYDKLQDVIKKTDNEMKILANTQEKLSKTYNIQDGIIASNKTLSWLKSNSAAAKDYGEALEELARKQKSATSSDELKDYTKQVNAIKAEAQALGKTGMSFGAEFKNAFGRIFQFTQIYGGIQNVIDATTRAVSELKEMDSILTEISKTSNLTDSELDQLGRTAFDAASQWGKTASDYLLGIQEMSRSGYYGKQAEEMAQTSILAQAAGDLDANMANSYLLASNAAYQYQGNVEKLNALLDGQNMITNRNSVSMQDMAEATTRAASMASELGVAENELSAMIGTIEARTKAGGDEVGNAIKSLLINVENINNDKIVGTFEKIGVAQTEFVNGMEQMRNPIDILEDLAEAFNKLDESDPLRTEILTNIGQKWQANKLSALLSGWSDYEKMLQDYSEGTGSAAIEAEKSANNWEGSLNKLSNAWTGLVQNFANSDAIVNVINLLTGLVKGIDSVTTAISPLATVLGGIGLYGGIKGGGKTSIQSYSSNRPMPPRSLAVTCTSQYY